MLCKETSLGGVSMIVILAASLAIVTLEELGIFGMAHGQENLTSSLTPEQKAAICSSVGSHVNTTESKICGIPTTPTSNTTSSENATTGPEADARE